MHNQQIQEINHIHGITLTRKKADKMHRELVKQSQAMLQEFLQLLGQLPFVAGKKALTNELSFLFEQYCGFDLPDNFTQEVGRRIRGLIREGRLPFVRALFGRGSHAGYKGIDLDLLKEAIEASRKPLK